MNKQEIFDKVVTHLLKQGKQSIRAGICQYRTKDGLKCAVGCLIDDEHYDESLEGEASSNEIVLAALELSGIKPRYSLMLSLLQRLHDDEGIIDNETYKFDIPSLINGFMIIAKRENVVLNLPPEYA